jgi:hypothetical protein
MDARAFRETWEDRLAMDPEQGGVLGSPPLLLLSRDGTLIQPSSRIATADECARSIASPGP